MKAPDAVGGEARVELEGPLLCEGLHCAVHRALQPRYMTPCSDDGTFWPEIWPKAAQRRRTSIWACSGMGQGSLSLFWHGAGQAGLVLAWSRAVWACSGMEKGRLQLKGMAPCRGRCRPAAAASSGCESSRSQRAGCRRSQRSPRWSRPQQSPCCCPSRSPRRPASPSPVQATALLVMSANSALLSALTHHDTSLSSRPFSQRSFSLLPNLHATGAPACAHHSTGMQPACLLWLCRSAHDCQYGRHST